MPVASEAHQGLRIHLAPRIPAGPWALTSWHTCLRSFPVHHLFQAALPDCHSAFLIPVTAPVDPLCGSQSHPTAPTHWGCAQDPVGTWQQPPRAASPEHLQRGCWLLLLPLRGSQTGREGGVHLRSGR